MADGPSAAGGTSLTRGGARGGARPAPTQRENKPDPEEEAKKKKKEMQQAERSQRGRGSRPASRGPGRGAGRLEENAAPTRRSANSPQQGQVVDQVARPTAWRNS